MWRSLNLAVTSLHKKFHRLCKKTLILIKYLVNNYNKNIHFIKNPNRNTNNQNLEL